ncbi:hypothetical protein IPG41_03510 [Candidatus Peregrinibacteria bacterium]|nr:MAG: hypothetical protein IPG41_03510 [Candidatus Peregrinibacteria bacterium]
MEQRYAPNRSHARHLFIFILFFVGVWFMLDPLLSDSSKVNRWSSFDELSTSWKMFLLAIPSFLFLVVIEKSLSFRMDEEGIYYRNFPFFKQKSILFRELAPQSKSLPYTVIIAFQESQRYDPAHYVFTFKTKEGTFHNLKFIDEKLALNFKEDLKRRGLSFNPTLYVHHTIFSHKCHELCTDKKAKR